MRVLIVEDQTMLRESLASAISAKDDMTVVGALGDASKVCDEVERTSAEVVLMDVCTENDSSGISATRQLKEKHPEVRVVIMTGMSDVTFVRQAREAGADSFIYKNVGTEDLLLVLRSTYAGYSTFPGNPLRNSDSGLDALTDEEIQIVKMVCESKTKKEIAQALFISEGTLKRRNNEILTKTGFDSMLKLAVHAVSTGFIVPNIK